MTNPSGRKSHWAIKAREAKQWKQLVWGEIFIRKAVPAKPLQRAKLTLTRYSSSSPDSDGLVSGFKHVIDGLVSAGVLVNDKFENIGMPTYLWEKASPKEGKIKVLIEAVSED